MMKIKHTYIINFSNTGRCTEEIGIECPSSDSVDSASAGACLGMWCCKREMATSTDFEVFLNETPTLKELRKYLRIGTVWEIFGEQFELDSIKLEDIRVRYESIDLKTSKMFQLLLDTKPNVKRTDIIRALKSPAVAKDIVASDYEKALKEGELVSLKHCY